MADKRRSKAIASKVNDTKKAETARPGGALGRAAKALEKASTREKKAQAGLDKGNNQLDTALLALEKTDVGSPQAREVERAARAALREVLVQRKKLRRARKALRRAEAKERKANDRAAAAAARKARAKAPAAQSRKAPKKGAAKKRQAAPRAKSGATKPSEMDTMPATEAISGADAGGVQEPASASRAGTPLR